MSKIKLKIGLIAMPIVSFFIISFVVLLALPSVMPPPEPIFEGTTTVHTTEYELSPFTQIVIIIPLIIISIILWKKYVI